MHQANAICSFSVFFGYAVSLNKITDSEIESVAWCSNLHVSSGLMSNSVLSSVWKWAKTSDSQKIPEALFVGHRTSRAVAPLTCYAHRRWWSYQKYNKKICCYAFIQGPISDILHHYPSLLNKNGIVHIGWRNIQDQRSKIIYFFSFIPPL